VLGVDLRPVARQSLPAGVFEQLSNQILSGGIEAGAALPAERALTESFGVNRQAVREALQRLAQAGLVEIRQGEPTRVRDFRRTAGLDLLTRLLVTDGGGIDISVVRSVMELRAAIGPDAARLAAHRAPAVLVDELVAVAGAMTAGHDLATLSTHSRRLWDLVIDGSDNIAYRLLLNALSRLYEPVEPLLHEVLAPELRDIAGHRAVADAIARSDADGAESAARAVLARGTDAMTRALTLAEAP
jgi:DNA-binding FadR family transcriptional regulator